MLWGVQCKVLLLEFQQFGAGIDARAICILNVTCTMNNSRVLLILSAVCQIWTAKTQRELFLILIEFYESKFNLFFSALGIWKKEGGNVNK